MSAVKVMLGLSGGVDSSVAAILLQQQGYDTTALFMKNWEEDDKEEYCAAAEDLRDCESISTQLNLPLRSMNFSSEYWDRVFAHFLSEYKAGRTPNPDILCNKEIKFRAFLDYALDSGIEMIATGHYARVGHDGDKFQLLRGRDRNKDQSYFLYTLGQRQLAHTLFPVGELEKPKVRQIAADHQLVTHNKRDSTGICFIGERRFKEFLQRYLPANPGNMITPEGEVIATHDGLMYYTLGQRQGLGIGGVAGYPEEPWFVIDKDLENNRLIVAQGHNHPLLFSHSLLAADLHWVSGETPELPYQCSAKVRYRQEDQPCQIESITDGEALIHFTEPQRAVTPGQSVVFYQNEVALGGGIIETTYR